MTASGSASFVSLHFSPRLLLASDLQKACHQNLLGSGHRRNCSLLFSCSRMTRPSSQAARLMFQRANVYSGCAISCSSGPQHVLPGSLPSRSSRICPALTVRARTVRTRLSLRRSQQTQRSVWHWPSSLSTTARQPDGRRSHVATLLFGRSSPRASRVAHPS